MLVLWILAICLVILTVSLIFAVYEAKVFYKKPCTSCWGGGAEISKMEKNFSISRLVVHSLDSCALQQLWDQCFAGSTQSENKSKKMDRFFQFLDTQLESDTHAFEDIYSQFQSFREFVKNLRSSGSCEELYRYLSSEDGLLLLRVAACIIRRINTTMQNLFGDAIQAVGCLYRLPLHPKIHTPMRQRKDWMVVDGLQIMPSELVFSYVLPFVLRLTRACSIPARSQSFRLRNHEVSSVSLICLRLLDVIEHCKSQEQPLMELPSTNRFDTLFEMSCANAWFEGEFLTVHLKFVHLVSQLVSDALTEGRRYDRVSVLLKRPPLPALFKTLSRTGSMSNLVILEVSKFLIYTLVSSTKYSPELVEHFVELGCTIFFEIMVRVSKSGSKRHLKELLNAFCLLFFLRGPLVGKSQESARPEEERKKVISQLLSSSIRGDRGCQLSFYQELSALLKLRATTDSEELRVLVHHAILFLLEQNSYQNRLDKNLAVSLLGKVSLNSYFAYHRRRFSLKTIALLSLQNFLFENVIIYSSIYDRMNCPSNVLMVSMHLKELIEENKISFAKPVVPSFIEIVLKLIHYPERYLRATLERNKEELGACCHILNGCLLHEEEVDASVPVDVEDVTCQLMIRLLDFLKVGLASREIRFEKMKLKRRPILNLVKRDRLRRHALGLMRVLLSNPAFSPSHILLDLVDLIATYCINGSAELKLNNSTLRAIPDVLDTISCMLCDQVTLKDAFREQNGFHWILQLFDSLIKILSVARKEEEADVPLNAISKLMYTLAMALRGNLKNRQDFKCRWQGWNQIASGLRSCLYIQENTRAVLDLSTCCFNMAFSMKHECAKHNRATKLQRSSFEQNFGLVPVLTCNQMLDKRFRDCPACMQCLLIEDTDPLAMAVPLISKFILEPPLLEQSSQIQQVLLTVLRVFKLLLKPVKNARILSSTNMCLQILTEWEEVFVHEYSCSFMRNVQQALLDILKAIEIHSISTLELSKYEEFLRSKTCPLSVLKTLCHISSKSVLDQNLSPSHALMFSDDMKNAVVRTAKQDTALARLTWPTKLGYTIALWLKYEWFFSPSKQSMTYPLPFDRPWTRCLLTLKSSCEKRRCEVRLILSRSDAKTHLNLTVLEFSKKNLSSTSWTATWSDVQLHPGRFYHLVVSHDPSSLNLVGGRNESSNVAACWINGLRVGRLSCPYPSVASSGRFCCKFGEHSGLEGSSVHRDRENAPVMVWSLGNAVALNRALQKDSDVLGLYLLGPNYVGGLAHLRIEVSPDLQVELIRHTNYLSGSVTDFADLKQSINISSLHEHIMFFFSSQRVSFARLIERDSLELFRSRNMISIPAEFSRFEVFPYSQTSVGDILSPLGGLPGLLYHFSTGQSSERQKLELIILRNVLFWNARNTRQFSDLSGYSIVARTLKLMGAKLDEGWLEIVFSICGISYNTKTCTYSSGLLNHSEAFKLILLNWKIWARAPCRVQMKLLRSLRDLLVQSKHACFNAWYARRQGIERQLLFILEEERPDYPPSQLFVGILARVMREPWEESDIRAIYSYLKVTHPGESEEEQGEACACPYGNGHSLSHGIYIPLESCPSLYEWKFDHDSQEGEGEKETASLGSSCSLATRGRGGEAAFASRELIWELVLKTISKYTLPLEIQFKYFSPKFLLSMLQTQIQSTRCLVLRTLEASLQFPSFLLEFKAIGGFTLCGQILAQYGFDETTGSILFSMLLSRPVSYDHLKRANLSSYVTSEEANNLAFVQVAVTLLIVVAGCQVAPRDKHWVVRALHDLFLHLKPEKNRDLLSEVANQLCNMLLLEYEHVSKRMQCCERGPEERTANSASEEGGSEKLTGLSGMDEKEVNAQKTGEGKERLFSNSADDGFSQTERGAEGVSGRAAREGARLEREEGEDPYECHWQVESDVVLFLQSLILSDLVGSGSYGLLLQAIFQLNVLQFPLEYGVTVQKWIVFAVLDFINSSSDCRLYLGIFAKNAALLINLLILLDSNFYSGLERLLTPNWLYKANFLDPSGQREIVLDELEAGGVAAQEQRSESILKMRSAAAPPFGSEAVEKGESVLGEKCDLAEVGGAGVGIDGIRGGFGSTVGENSSLEGAPDMADSGCPSFAPTGFGGPFGSSSATREGVPGFRRRFGRLQVDALQLADLIFNIFYRYCLEKKTVSSFWKKMSQGIQKLYGRSWREIETDLPCAVERYVFYAMMNGGSRLDSGLLELVLTKLLNLEKVLEYFASGELVLAHFLLKSRLECIDRRQEGEDEEARERVQRLTLEVWKKLCSKADPRVVSKVLEVNDVDFILLVRDPKELRRVSLDRVKRSVVQFLKADHYRYRRWVLEYGAKIGQIEALWRREEAALKSRVSRISEEWSEDVGEVCRKPRLEYVCEILLLEQRTRRSWKKVLGEAQLWSGLLASSTGVSPLILWKVDPTEGPMHMRPRLKPMLVHDHPVLRRCAGPACLDANTKRVFSHLGEGDWKRVEELKRWEGRLKEQRFRLSIAREGMKEVFPFDCLPRYRFVCARVTSSGLYEGELVMTETSAYILRANTAVCGDKDYDDVFEVPKRLAYREVREIHKRRYALMSVALEIFTTTGRTWLLCFQTRQKRDRVYETFLYRLDLRNLVDHRRRLSLGDRGEEMGLFRRWKKGLITNFEYLMYLNVLSGRTYNDLTQYPVFPFILSDYDSPALNLEDPSAFRNLEAPMGMQNAERLRKFVERYHALVELKEKPYYYGSHYSNIGIVLHFLMRVEPFAYQFVELQSGKFDVPDRLFHCVKQAWQSSSSESPSDVKELIPEFFYFPDFLLNVNGFDFGARQNGAKVDDVVLPAWADRCAYRFVRQHMEALECEYVSMNINHWIDLIFGYRQAGSRALKTYNMFHPYTYEGGVSLRKITDLAERMAVISQINSYGQIPVQLFKKPHPKRSPRYLRNMHPNAIHVALDRLRYSHEMPAFKMASVFYVNRAPLALGKNQTLLWPEGTHVLRWRNWDRSVQVLALKSQLVEYEMPCACSGPEEIQCVDVAETGSWIAAGLSSGLICVWRASGRGRFEEPKGPKKPANENLVQAWHRERMSHSNFQENVQEGHVDPTSDSEDDDHPCRLNCLCDGQRPLEELPDLNAHGLRTSLIEPPSNERTPVCPDKSAEFRNPDFTGNKSELALSDAVQAPIQELLSERCQKHDSTGLSGCRHPWFKHPSPSPNNPFVHDFSSLLPLSFPPGKFTPSVSLCGHKSPVSCIKASARYHLIITGSDDGSVILWNAYRLRPVRILLPPQKIASALTALQPRVTHLDVQAHSGEIVVVQDTSDRDRSSLSIYSINGHKLASKNCPKISAVVTTSEKPGRKRNAVITGHANGKILIWSILDLNLLKTIQTRFSEHVTALCLDDDNTCLFAGLERSKKILCYRTGSIKQPKKD